MEKKFKLLPPIMPNFLFFQSGPRPRQEGFKTSDRNIPIEELTEEEAIEYGQLMKEAFIEHWKKKKSSKKL